MQFFHHGRQRHYQVLRYWRTSVPRQSYDPHQPRPTIFHKGYYQLMRLLQILGLASIVESFQVWTGFFQQIVDLYQQWVRAPLFAVVLALWPAGWPAPPKIGADLLIVWGTFFAAASYHVYHENGRNIVGHIYNDEYDLRRGKTLVMLRTAMKLVTIFLIGPILYPILAIRHYLRGGTSEQPLITPWLVMRPRSILKYVGRQILILGLLLFISYQMKIRSIL
jgi:hypothetical protein